LYALIGQPTKASHRLSALGRIERTGKRYRLTLSVRGGDAMRERTMTADSCDDLSGAAVVALGLLVGNGSAGPGGDDHASGAGASPTHAAEAGSSGGEAAGTGAASGGRSESGSAAPLAASASKESPGEKQNPKHEDERASPGISNDTSTTGERRWRMLLRAPIGVLSLGRLPKPSGGIAAGVGASYDKWSVNFVARVFGSQTVSSQNAYEAGARVGRRDLKLGVCRDWRVDRFVLAPCLAAAIQRETASGSGPGVTPTPASHWSAVIAAELDARWVVTDWLSLATSVAFGVETSRPTLEVTTAGEVTKLGSIDLSFSLGPQWTF
jgi:hypothetical protein